MTSQIRLGADIGGTFTDIALECRGAMYSTKVLTNYTAPEQAILDGIVAKAEGTRHVRRLRRATGRRQAPVAGAAPAASPTTSVAPTDQVASAQ